MTNEEILEYLKPFMLDGTEKAGDVVWSNRYGYQRLRILNKIELPNCYGVRGEDLYDLDFTAQGRESEDDIFPTLFKRCPYEQQWPRVMEVNGNKTNMIGKTTLGSYVSETAYVFQPNEVREIQPENPEIAELQKKITELQEQLKKLKS